MSTTSTAEQTDVLVDATTLNTYPLADIFVAVGPARVIAEGVTVGPVFTDEGEKFLVRYDREAGQLARTEEQVLKLAGPSIRRHVENLESRRHRAVVFAKWQAERDAKIAACPGHVMREYAQGRGHVLACKFCGFSDGINSAD